MVLHLVKKNINGVAQSNLSHNRGNKKLIYYITKHSCTENIKNSQILKITNNPISENVKPTNLKSMSKTSIHSMHLSTSSRPQLCSPKVLK